MNRLEALTPFTLSEVFDACRPAPEDVQRIAAPAPVCAKVLHWIGRVARPKLRRLLAILRAACMKGCTLVKEDNALEKKNTTSWINSTELHHLTWVSYSTHDGSEDVKLR